jgi:acyl-CoA dehydrogenase
MNLTDEQRNVRDLARRFAEDVIRPASVAADQEQKLPLEVIRQGWELGLTNLSLPVEFGGNGLPLVDQCIVVEELAWGCAGITTSLAANDLAMTPVVLGASDALKKQYLAPLAEEPTLAAFALTEPSAGSDVAGLRTVARRSAGGNGYSISGAKQFISNGSHAEWYVVFAKTAPDAGHRGISAFVVPREVGVVVDRKEDKLGQRASDTAGLSFDAVEIPAENLIGEENQGFYLAMQTLDRTRPTVAAASVGITRAALEHARDYAREREQFGQPITEFQAIQFLLADMATELAAARLLTEEAARLMDEGAEGATLMSSHAKRFAADAAMTASLNAVQIFGGYGYTKDYPVEKLMRDAKLMQIYEGTAQVQRVVIARQLLAGAVV